MLSSVRSFGGTSTSIYEKLKLYWLLQKSFPVGVYLSTGYQRPRIDSSACPRSVLEWAIRVARATWSVCQYPTAAPSASRGSATPVRVWVLGSISIPMARPCASPIRTRCPKASSPALKSTVKPSRSTTTSSGNHWWWIRPAAIAWPRSCWKSTTLRITCNTVLMIVRPPGEPMSNQGRPSRTRIVGDMLDNILRPGRIRLGGVPAN